jgi:hypothetical protein
VLQGNGQKMPDICMQGHSKPLAQQISLFPVGWQLFLADFFLYLHAAN